MRKIVVNNLYNDTINVNSPTTFNSCNNIHVIPGEGYYQIHTKSLIRIYNDFELNNENKNILNGETIEITFYNCGDVKLGLCWNDRGFLYKTNSNHKLIYEINRKEEISILRNYQTFITNEMLSPILFKDFY